MDNVSEVGGVLRIEEVFMNKQILYAIQEKMPLHWEYGYYRTHYRGLKLIAKTGIFESGGISQKLLYATTSVSAARRIYGEIVDAGHSAKWLPEMITAYEHASSKHLIKKPWEQVLTPPRGASL